VWFCMGLVSLGVARCVVLQWGLGVWTVGMGHVACGKEASWCGVVWGLYGLRILKSVYFQCRAGQC